MVLLIDERPEEVTEMERSVKGEKLLRPLSMNPQLVMFKWPKWLLKKAKRLAESKKTLSFFLTLLHVWPEPTTPFCSDFRQGFNRRC